MKTKITMAIVLSAFLALVSCGGGDVKNSAEYKNLKASLDKIEKQDSLEKANIEAYKKLNEDFMAGKKDEVMAIYADDYEDHNCDSSMSKKKGKEAMGEMMDWVTATHSNMSMTYDHIYAEDDMVYAHGKMKGKNTGTVDPKYPATNKSFDVDYFEIVRFKDGKIKERWGLMDSKTAEKQLGVQW